MTVYEQFLEANGLEESMYHGNTSLIVKKDGSDAWTDPITGKGFKALSNEVFFEMVFNVGTNTTLERIASSPYNTQSPEPKILFNLTMNELVELIKNQPDGAIKERLKTAQNVWEDFINSQKAEENGG